jgi:lipopolysaccharide transport system permease protein
MSVRYGDVAVEAEGLLLRSRFRLEGELPEAWGGGGTLSYHVFDPETDTVMYDGPRVAIAGTPSPFDLSIELPPEPGRYRVFVSPMHEQAGWLYDRGGEFLLIDAVVEGGAARLERARVSNTARLGRERLRRTVARAFRLPFETIWRNRSLIHAMVRRDILGRYRGSFAGVFWTVLNPLLLMLTYFFVFGVVLQARFAGDPSRSGFALYFLAGMLPWLAFSEAAGRSPFLMLEYRNFIKKLVFPVETLPVNVTAAGLVTEGFGILLFAVALVVLKAHLPASVLWLPALLIPQILFTAGICWFLSALGVFVRDLLQVNGFLLTLWFFLTPICYPESSLPAWTLPVLSKNPMYVLVRGYRDIFLEGRAPAFGPLWKLWLLAAVVFLAGHAWFYKLRRSFADII